MDRYYLAVDIGASSGRHMLASMKDGKMHLEEVYRFPNGMDDKTAPSAGMWTVFLRRSKMVLKNVKRSARSRFPWPSTHGVLTMCCSIKTTGSSAILWDTVTAAQRAWTRKLRGDPQDELYARTGIQKRSLIPFISLWL